MSTAAKHDPDTGCEPAFAAPKNACDAHFHVFGREEQYPYYALDLRYKPPYEPLEAYMKLARRLGFERFVFVQPSAYGFDNSCMLDAMAEVAPKLRRGIVHLDETKPNDAVLGKWHAQGVRGVRVNVSPVRKPEAGFADHLRPEIVRTARDLPRARLAPRLPVARLADQRAHGHAERAAGRVLGSAHGALSGQGRTQTAGFPGVPAAGRRRLQALLGEAHRHLSLLAGARPSPM